MNGVPTVVLGEAPPLADAWQARAMLWTLARRLISVRYKETMIGAAWAVLQPFLLMIVFTVFLGLLTRIPSDGIPYPLFYYSGLFFWGVIAQTLSQAATAVTGNPHLLTKVYFPRFFLPGAVVIAAFFDLLVAVPTLLALAVWCKVEPSVGLLLMPLAVVIVFLLSLGLALWVSALNVFYRDINYLLPLFTQTWMFASPIIYPSSLVPLPWRALYDANPLAAPVEITRWALAGGPPVGFWSVATSLSLTVCILLGGLRYFVKHEPTFVDRA